MSLIFPEKPSKVNIHLLPSKAELFTYKITDYFVLSAWLPDNANNLGTTGTVNASATEFYKQFCRSCPHYHNNEDDEDYEPCYAYNSQYDGESCMSGHSYESLEAGFSTANMAFQVKFNHLGDEPRFQYKGDSAFIQSAVYKDGMIHKSQRYRAANVHGSSDHPENICWGTSLRPNSLREAVDTYFSTPFNSDLLSLTQFKRNNENIRTTLNKAYSNIDTLDSFTVNQLIDICRNSGLSRYSRLNKGQLLDLIRTTGVAKNFVSSPYSPDPTEKYLCSSADAMMIIDAEQDRMAFFTMLSAGFTSIPEVPHVMMIPMKTDTFTKGGHQYYGHITYPDAVGKNWYIYPESTNTGVLVGQI